MRKACAGEYRLLYLSPERLARPDTIGWLQQRAGRLLRHRRSALHLRMGARVPSGIPAVERACASISRTCPSRRSRPAPRGACGTTFCSSCSCATRTNTSPAFTGPICATWCRSANERTQPRLLVKALRALCRQQRDRLRARPSRAWKRRWISWRSSGIAAIPLSRQDGHRQAAAQPGALDVGRSARAGGDASRSGWASTRPACAR